MQEKKSSSVHDHEYLQPDKITNAQIVRRMIGQKIGTGGSPGYDYLRKISEKYHIFMDFQKIATLLIPRFDLFEFPEALTNGLGFHFSTMKK